MATLLHFEVARASTAKQRLQPVPFANIPECKYEWVVQDLIPKGESIMVTGDFASFKSYLSYFLADAISQGIPFVSRNVSQHPVLVLDCENSHATVRLRGYLVGNLKSAQNVYIMGRFTPRKAPPLNDKDLLDFCREERPVVIIDSMQDFHPGLKENSSDDMAIFSGWVNGLIDAGAVSVILLHHNNRSGDYRGSSGIPAGMGGAIAIKKIGSTGVRLDSYKTRDGEDRSIEIKLNFAPGQVTYEIVTSGLDKTEDLKARIVQHVKSDGGCSTSNVVDSVGGRRQDVYDAVQSLVENRRLTKLDKQLYTP